MQKSEYIDPVEKNYDGCRSAICREIDSNCTRSERSRKMVFYDASIDFVIN